MTDTVNLPSTASDPPAATARRPRRRLRWALTSIGLLAAVLVLLIGYLVLAPVGVADPDGVQQPTATYAEAMARFDTVAQREAARGDLLPECRSRVVGSPQRAARSIVLFHGYTNCPQQFEVLGEALAAEGFNVYIPLMPEHGESDRERTTLAQLTAEELIDYANESVDIATGLGDEVTVLGLSGGGAVTSYLAQFRDDVDLAVPIAPYLGIPAVPEPLTPALVNLASLLPPVSIGTSASQVSGSGIYAPYAYFDNNTRSAAAYMRLGQVTLDDAQREPHRAARTITVVNDADDTVNIPMIDTLTNRWRTLAPGTTDEYRFDAALGLPHDVIGPDRADQRTEEVYPVLLELLGRP